MQRKPFSTLLVLLGVFVVMAPSLVFAETSLAQLAQCSGPDCSACNVVHMANGFIKWLIGMTFLLFAVLFAVAGVKLVTSGGNSHVLDEAKNSFVNAIIGLIIILSAWLIVDTIIRGLVGHDGKLADTGSASGWLYWSEVTCQKQTEPDTYKAWQNHIALSLQNVGAWAVGSDGLPSSACAITGYSGAAPVYDCTAQIAQCVDHGGGTPNLSSDGQSVACIPDADAAASMGGSGGCAAPSDLKTVPGTSFQNRSSIVDSFVAMRSAAAADHITLTLSSAYRSDSRQLDIWRSHHCDTVAGHCSGYVARPCGAGGNGSNHSRGDAFDISGSVRGSAIYNWLKANGGRFGFYNNLGADDPYHWSPSGR